MKVYYTQEKIASDFTDFFKFIFKLSKPILKVLSFVVIGMISAESIVTSDISRKLKDDFSYIQLDSIERRFRRFFKSFYPFSYKFYAAFINYIVLKFSVKHSDNKVHISFDHMFCKDKFTILLFSLRVGKQGIPIWFRCFKGTHNPNAYSLDLIKEGISYCANLFSNKNYHVIFLADRWFPHVDILKHISSLNCFFVIRSKSFFTFSYYNSSGIFVTEHLRDIKPIVQHSKIFRDAYYTRRKFKTNIVVSNSSTPEPWYLITNDNPSIAIKSYSYRFGSVECIFKSQKSNGFRLESTNTQKIEHFISMFTIMCVALVWLIIIGVDYSKNKKNYSIKIRDVKKGKNTSKTRLISYFNIGLTLFNRCYYNSVNFTLKFNFVLYDV